MGRTGLEEYQRVHRELLSIWSRLPDRDFHLADNPQFDGLRAAYLTYLTNVGTALGFESPARAPSDLRFEKSMAHPLDTRRSRNRDKTYNKFTPDALRRARVPMGSVCERQGSRVCDRYRLSAVLSESFQAFPED